MLIYVDFPEFHMVILQIRHGKVYSKTPRRGTGKAIQIALGKHDHLTGSSEKVLDIYQHHLVLIKNCWLMNHVNPGLINHGLLIRRVLLQ